MSDVAQGTGQRELERIERFYRTIVSSMKSGLAIIGSDRSLAFANDSFYTFYHIDQQEPQGMTIDDILPATRGDGPDIREQIMALRPGDSPLEFRGIKLYRLPHEERTINVHASPIAADDTNSIMLLIDNVTASTKRTNQVSMLKKISDMMHGTLELDRLFHLILTCVTAGSGLGFSRAMLLLVSDDEERLVGKMGVGPTDLVEAQAIWLHMSKENKTIDDMLADTDAVAWHVEQPLNKLVKEMNLSLHDENDIVVATVLEKKMHHVRNSSEDPRVSDAFIKTIGSEEFVLVPIVARDCAVGVVIADNAFSGSRIGEGAVELLTLFANQAGLAIENGKAYEGLRDKMKKLSQAYTDLSEAQDNLIRAQRLAAIGEMAARVAHEIRNPLVTIGGFARALRKQHDGGQVCNLDDREKVIHNLDVIIDEVIALEEILARVIDFSRPDTPRLHLSNINRVVDDTIALIQAGPKRETILFERQFQADLPDTFFDARQLRQVFYNLIQNAIEALGDEGRITVQTRTEEGQIRVTIEDEGEGIPPEQMADLFSPFFTTKVAGTGLGLAVVRKIVTDHGGQIDVTSQPGHGSAFTVTLPFITVPAEKNE